MEKGELQKAVLAKMAESDVKTQEVTDDSGKKSLEVVKTDEVSKETESGTEEKATEDKKTGFQKRLDRLHREKMEAIEAAKALQAQLEELKAQKTVKSEESETDSEFELDENSKKYLERVVSGLLESQLKQKEELENQQRIQTERQMLTKEFESTMLKEFANEFDEEGGYFSDEAVEKMQKLHNQFQTNPKWWLDAMKNYGVDKAYTLATLGEITPKVESKKDSVDKILEKERLMKTLTPESSNVKETIKMQAGESKKNFLNRIVSKAIEQVK